MPDCPRGNPSPMVPRGRRARFLEFQKRKRQPQACPTDNVKMDLQLMDIAPLARVPLPELFSLKNRTYIVTGAARGLGLTVARSLLEAGAHVHCLDMLPRPDADAWAEAESTATSHQLSITYHQVDVTSQQSLSSTFAHIFSSATTAAPIKGLYVAAGINQLKPALEYTPEDFRKVIDVNLTGTFFCAQAFAKEWFERNPGVDGTAGKGASIVLTGSMSGHVANAGLLCTAYNASKAGVSSCLSAWRRTEVLGKSTSKEPSYGVERTGNQSQCKSTSRTQTQAHAT
jgi:NAD(P)-dependent dehydrogenase (short-subunit alcohol dehydrogenase family)